MAKEENTDEMHGGAELAIVAPHVQRVIDEELQLKERIDKLYDFTQSDKIDTIGGNQKTLLLIQLETMRSYWRCLVARITDFGF